jgi:hypothetical protein
MASWNGSSVATEFFLGIIVGFGSLMGPCRYSVGCHAVSSGGVSVTMDPFRRWIWVATGATATGEGGRFSFAVAASGMAVNLPGEV